MKKHGISEYIFSTQEVSHLTVESVLSVCALDVPSFHVTLVWAAYWTTIGCKLVAMPRIIVAPARRKRWGISGSMWKHCKTLHIRHAEMLNLKVSQFFQPIPNSHATTLIHIISIISRSSVWHGWFSDTSAQFIKPQPHVHSAEVLTRDQLFISSHYNWVGRLLISGLCPTAVIKHSSVAARWKRHIIENRERRAPTASRTLVC